MPRVRSFTIPLASVVFLGNYVNQSAVSDGARRRRSALRIAIPLLVFGALLAASCSSDLPQSSLNPKSAEAEQINHLWHLVFGISVVVFVIVEAALVYAIIRFRKRPGDGVEPKQVHGNTRLEIVWSIIPAIVLALVAVPTLQTLFDLTRPAEGDVLRVEVVGHQWWWEFRYPDILDAEGRPLTTANELHLPAGKTAELHMTSRDVIHSFWVPSLSGKRDAVPGRDTFLKITPDADVAGQVIPGQCAEYCGLSHADMRFLVFVDAEADFADWTMEQTEPTQIPTDGPEAAGYETFTQICTTCHQAVVVGDAGVDVIGTAFGPDLTHVGSRSTIAAAVKTNTAEHLAEWIDSPVSVKPMAPELNDLAAGRVLGMPDYGLDQRQIAELVALLEAWK